MELKTLGIIFSIVCMVFACPNLQSGSTLIETAFAVNATTTKEKSVIETVAYLKIPKLNLYAPVESLGTTKEGAIDVPTNFANVAWFNKGPLPGGIGSSIIDGHSGWKNGNQAVFDTLHNLEKGDYIYVESRSGKTIIFRVREVKTYNENGETSDIFLSDDEGAHLNLVTCAGTWDAVKQTHSSRLVVFTDKISS